MISEERSGTRTTRISRPSCAETIHSGAVASRWKSSLRARPTIHSIPRRTPLSTLVNESKTKNQTINQSKKQSISENKLNTKQAAESVKLALENQKDVNAWTRESREGCHAAVPFNSEQISLTYLSVALAVYHVWIIPIFFFSFSFLLSLLRIRD